MNDYVDIEMEILSDEELEMDIFRGSGGGTSNYNSLTNKPQINGVTLIGNKTSREIKVQDLMDEITEQDIDEIIYGG